MTIYSDLLDLALRERDADDRGPTDDTLAELVRCRARLPVEPPAPPVLDDVADQLAYDVALVRHAEYLGIRRDVSPFARPPEGRRALERSVGARWIDPAD
jgi:hypothetical protein